MNYLDILILLIIAWGIFRGFSRGLIRELASLAAIISGIYAGMWFYGTAAEKLSLWLRVSRPVLNICAFAMVVLAVMTLVYFLSSLLDHLVKFLAMGLLNRIGGALFGLLKYLTLAGALVLLADHLNQYGSFIPEKASDTSVLYSYLLESARVVFPFLTDSFSSVTR